MSKDPKRSLSAADAARAYLEPPLPPAELQRLQRISRDLGKQTDRGAATQAAALIHDELERTMRTAGGPTAIVPTDFGPRINAAQKAGLFGTVTQADLHLVRQIRNAFAHDAEPRAFTSPEIEPLCRQLQLPSVAWKGPQPSDARGQFLTAITVVFQGISGWKTQRSVPDVLP